MTHDLLYLSYNCSSRDALLIELPTTITVSGDDVELWSRNQIGKIDITNIDSRFWFLSVDGGLPRRTVEIATNPYELGMNTVSFDVCDS